MKELDLVQAHNEKSWDLQVQQKNRWTIPVSADQIKLAKQGQVEIVLTPNKKVPQVWLGRLEGKKILGLASGGGQQGPLLAAAGADVTIADISQEQLNQDKKIADEFGLHLKCLHSTASDLKEVEDGSIDLVINPTSNCFFQDLPKVWKEVGRVLRPGGEILWGFLNPINYAFDFEKKNKGVLEVVYQTPYSDIESLSEDERKKYIGNEVPLEFGHSLSDQIGTLLSEGFVMMDMFEDFWGEDSIEDKFFPSFIAARARKIG